MALAGKRSALSCSFLKQDSKLLALKPLKPLNVAFFLFLINRNFKSYSFCYHKHRKSRIHEALEFYFWIHNSDGY